MLCGRLPPGCRHIERDIGVFRRALERAVVDARGEVSLADAASIQTITRLEAHARLAARWLRERAASMDDETRLRYSAAIAATSERRDRVLERLGLRRDKDVISRMLRELYRGGAEADEDEPEKLDCDNGHCG